MCGVNVELAAVRSVHELCPHLAASECVEGEVGTPGTARRKDSRQTDRQTGRHRQVRLRSCIHASLLPQQKQPCCYIASRLTVRRTECRTSDGRWRDQSCRWGEAEEEEEGIECATPMISFECVCRSPTLVPGVPVDESSSVSGRRPSCSRLRLTPGRPPLTKVSNPAQLDCAPRLSWCTRCPQRYGPMPRWAARRRCRVRWRTFGPSTALLLAKKPTATQTNEQSVRADQREPTNHEEEDSMCSMSLYDTPDDLRSLACLFLLAACTAESAADHARVNLPTEDDCSLQRHLTSLVPLCGRTPSRQHGEAGFEHHHHLILLPSSS